MVFRRILTIFCILALFASSVFVVGEEVKPVKYVFLFIGDGFSIPQRMMAEEFLQKSGQPGLYLNSFPNQVLTTTRSADSFITDSAASGTAIACGEKTKSGQIGVSTDGSRNLVSVAEVARDSGRKVGIVTSVTINHATPASFYGHNISRSNYYELGLDLINSSFDYFGGGGIDKQDDSESTKYQGKIYDIAAKKGYTVLHDAQAIKALKPGCGKIIACQEKGALPYTIDHQDGLTLSEYTQKGIELLDNPKGFFMMVEGGKIDWVCHSNDAAAVLWDIIEFDKAVKQAKAFMDKHPEDTLIVVTGDHETGGLTLGFAGTGYKSYIERLNYQKCSLESFQAMLNNLAREKKNKVSFEDIKPLVKNNFGLLFNGDDNDPMTLNKIELDSFREAFHKSFDGKKVNVTPFSLCVLRCFNNKAALAWTSTAHTALPVNTSAVGANADSFKGMIDNTNISITLKKMVR